MASISLPRVLQPRKTSLEIERENFEKFQSQSISKAINTQETPVKPKHVRSTLIGTFHEKGAITFWVVALRLPLQENRIVAWKFCHVLHIILREGHYNCLDQSQRHTGMIEDLGKLWVHLREGYGKLIQLYCTLLITKIKFHQRNHRFPGNLQLTGEELDAIGENDINNYFQMSVEIFDYMDDVLTLQAAIFESIDARSTSMTSAGQCRLAPILPCVQDSNQLYDFSVKLLFKLHSMLPPDTLSGHRERFLKQFKLLKKFYQKTHVMQYFKNLITIPSLPSNPPNFLIQSELRTYIPPVVILPPEEEHYPEEQDLIGTLIDTSDTSSQLTSPDTPSDLVDYVGPQSSQPSDPIIERDTLIGHLQSEISRSRSEIHSMIADHRATMLSVNEHVSSLENQLTAAKDDLEHERKQRSILLEQQKQTPSTPEFEKRIHAAEDRAKNFEEKFQILKSAYTQMKEEHINLIRQKAECDKQSNSMKKTTSELEMKIEALQKSNDLLLEQNSKVKEIHVQNASAKSEAQMLKQDLDTLSEKYNREKEEMNNIVGELQIEISKLRLEREQFENYKEVTINMYNLELQKINERNEFEKDKLIQNILKLEEICKFNNEKEELWKENEATNIHNREQEMNQVILKHQQEKEILTNSLSEVQHNLSHLLVEIDKLKKESELKHNMLTEESNLIILQHKEEKNELKKTLSLFENNLNDLTNTIEQSQRETESLKSKLLWCNNEKSTLECELQDLLQQKLSIEDSLNVISEKFKDAEIALSREISNASLARWSLMKSTLQSSTEIIKGTIHELDNPAISSLQCGLEYFRSLTPLTGDALNLLEKALVTYEKEKTPSEDVAIHIVQATHLISTNVIQGVATSNTSKDIVFGEQMSQECRELANAMFACINYVKLLDERTAGSEDSILDKKSVTNGGDGKTTESYIGSVRRLLESVGALAEQVGGQDESRAGDSVEGELANMDKAIEEAVARIEEMLRKSRATESGLKLEVNEKILDACTSLMESVRELVKKARSLQGEIVSHGRGTNTAKEFYKRNHQWTEGLISAAKAVAMGATLLLTAADKVVSSSGGKLEHVMVASQEIAASTAQLVVASRVRAARGSERLGALTLASRAVTSATGVVIATAKACATMVEESEDLDMSGMSWQAGRRLEMESRVRVLELEQSLATERLKLAALRRTHYRLEQSEEADAKI